MTIRDSLGTRSKAVKYPGGGETNVDIRSPAWPADKSRQAGCLRKGEETYAASSEIELGVDYGVKGLVTQQVSAIIHVSLLKWG